MTLPLPPSVNTYWRVRPKGKYLSDRAKRFRADVVALVAKENSIRTHTGRIKAVLTIHQRNKGKCDIDNYAKGTLDVLTHCRIIADDELIDDLHIIRGAVKVELFEIKEYMR